MGGRRTAALNGSCTRQNSSFAPSRVAGFPQSTFAGALAVMIANERTSGNPGLVPNRVTDLGREGEVVRIEVGKELIRPLFLRDVE